MILKRVSRRQLLSIVPGVLALAGCRTVTKKKKNPEGYNLDAPPPPFEAGVQYLYSHVGPRPFSDGAKDCTGSRVVSVLGRDPDFQNLWVIEDRFQCGQGVEAGLYDDNYLRHRKGLRSDQGTIQIEEAPPAQLRYLGLKKKQKKTYQTTQTFLTASGEPVGAARMTEEVERQFDYRIINPIGAILCRYFKTNVKIEANLNGVSMNVAASIDSYWSDTLHWFVETECEFQPMKRGEKVIGPAYKAKSVLQDIQEANA